MSNRLLGPIPSPGPNSDGASLGPEGPGVGENEPNSHTAHPAILDSWPEDDPPPLPQDPAPQGSGSLSGLPRAAGNKTFFVGQLASRHVGGDAAPRNRAVTVGKRNSHVVSQMAAPLNNDSHPVTPDKALSTSAKAQSENASKVFLDMHFSGRISQDKYNDQIALLGADSISESMSNGANEFVDELLKARRACETPTYKTFSAIGIACTRPKFDIFTLMIIVAIFQQCQNCAYDGLSLASFIFTLTSEFFICIICLSERWVLMRKVLLKIFPEWILKIKSAPEGKQSILLQTLHSQKKFDPENTDTNAPACDKSLITQFDEKMWEYSVPFLVYFRRTFAADIRVFNHKIPRALSPALLFTRALANIMVISSALILRSAVVSFNSQMFKQAIYVLPFNVNANVSWPTEFNVCNSMNIPAPPKNIGSLFGFNFELIHTPNILNLFIVLLLGLSVKYFSLRRKCLDSLQMVGLELRRHKLKYHNGSAMQETAYSLWHKINNFWVEDMISGGDDFLAEIMGFRDVEINPSGQSPLRKKQPAAAVKRLIILSVLPLLISCIAPVIWYLASDPSLGDAFLIPCFEKSGLELFSPSVIGNCSAASDNLVWPPNNVYYYSCIRCAILIHGSFSKPAYYSIYVLCT